MTRLVGGKAITLFTMNLSYLVVFVNCFDVRFLNWVRWDGFMLDLLEDGCS